MDVARSTPADCLSSLPGLFARIFCPFFLWELGFFVAERNKGLITHWFRRVSEELLISDLSNFYLCALNLKCWNSGLGIFLLF
jgi:hypothetical protein